MVKMLAVPGIKTLMLYNGYSFPPNTFLRRRLERIHLQKGIRGSMETRDCTKIDASHILKGQSRGNDDPEKTTRDSALNTERLIEFLFKQDAKQWNPYFLYITCTHFLPANAVD